MLTQLKSVAFVSLVSYDNKHTLFCKAFKAKLMLCLLDPMCKGCLNIFHRISRSGWCIEESKFKAFLYIKIHVTIVCRVLSKQKMIWPLKTNLKCLSRKISRVFHHQLEWLEVDKYWMLQQTQALDNKADTKWRPLRDNDCFLTKSTNTERIEELKLQTLNEAISLAFKLSEFEFS